MCLFLQKLLIPNTNPLYSIDLLLYVTSFNFFGYICVCFISKVVLCNSFAKMFVCCHYPAKLPFRMKKDTSSNKHNGCFIIIMNGIVRYMYIVRMLAHCGCYNEIVVPNCKKREAGENLLFHLDFASDCKKISRTIPLRHWIYLWAQ